jgi:hypothetical protein
MPKFTNVITLTEYAETHGLDVKRLRRIARNGDWPDAGNAPFKFGGKNGVWAIDADAPCVVLPPKSARGTRRPDGRQRYIVFCNTTEHTAIANIVGDDNVVDPRITSKQRRDARKLRDAEYFATADALENDDNG